jgi:endonuclease-3
MYGRRHKDPNHPTDCLIATILSQHTADRNSAGAFRALKQRYGSWAEIASAPPGELAETIREAGLARLKARYIQGALLALQERYGTMDASFLRAMPLEDARSVLRSLPGVGPKTAACVLLFSCEHAALPVDTHVHRVSRRLGLIGPRTSAEEAHEELSALVDLDDVYDFHVNLIAHGRAVCRALDPRCGECSLQTDCDFFTGRLHDD